MKAISIGILSALFFAVTFVINHMMADQGGSWIYSSSLRFIFMVPFLLLYVLVKGTFNQTILHIKNHFGSWLLWSTCGFVLFYVPLTYAASFSPGWLISGTWQITIVCGMMLAPLFYEKIFVNGQERTIRHHIPWRSLMISSIMCLGIILIQAVHFSEMQLSHFLIGFLTVLIAAFSYPLGNRKMMAVVEDDLGTIERVFGMTLVTLPIWIVLFLYGIVTEGPPAQSQVLQAFIVALFSGIIATILFFYATQLVSKDQEKLAAVEATQSLEVIFAMIGEIIFMGIALPGPMSLIGIALIIFGMMVYSYFSVKMHKKEVIEEKVLHHN